MDRANNYMQNREISWLRFNERVLEEAMDDTVPLLERLKFVEIFTKNLDEFFMIRVGSLLDLSKVNPDHIDSKSGMNPQEQLDAIYRSVHPLYIKRDRCFFEIFRQLQVHGIQYLSFQELRQDEIKFVKHFFKQSVAPILSPQIIDSHHPFPHLQNKLLHVVTRLKYKGKETFGCVPIPAVLPNILFLPGHGIRFISVGAIVQEYIHKLFPGYICTERMQLRLTRNADITTGGNTVDMDSDFRKKMQRILGERKRMTPVRLELSDPISNDLKQFLCTKISLEPHQIYIAQVPLLLQFSCQIESKLDEANKSILSYPLFTPQMPVFSLRNVKISRLLQSNDILLSYPYESMNPFLQLLKESAYDPNVLSIKITIYRLASKAKLVDYLCAAAENGKDVMVLIELRARFDEQNNIDWSERLEEAGCTIIYGFQNYKVHSKLCLIKKSDHGTIRYITQVGTGNYNEKTATMYTDLSLLTSDTSIGNDVNEFFKNMMIGNLNGSYKHLLVAPVNLKSTILSLIDQEIAKGNSGQILLKLNSVTDLELIKKLRDASRAGVKIILIVRGICCILPDVIGETENIHIRSIVGRFLEHSRIYCFGTGNDEKMYISSADFMTRNMLHRVEAACPIFDPNVRTKIHHILNTCMRDNLRARQLHADGTYSRIVDNQLPTDSQQQLISESIGEKASSKQSFWEKIKLRIQ